MLIPHAPAIGARLAAIFSHHRSETVRPGGARLHPHEVIIIGFGPAGQRAARAFEADPRRPLIVDLNLEGIRKASELGFDGLLGDASQIDVLEHAHVEAAQVVVVTIPHTRAANLVVDAIRRLLPHSRIETRFLPSPPFCCNRIRTRPARRVRYSSPKPKGLTTCAPPPL